MRGKDEPPAGTLHAGAFGQVIAVKNHFPEHPQGLVMKVNKDKSSFKDFLNEAKLLARFEHPHIVPCPGYLCKPQHQCTFILMPKLEEQLNKRIIAIHSSKAPRPLSLQNRLLLTRQAAEALDYVHSRGLVHRDVSSSNLMLASDNHLYLIDFGRTLPEGTKNPDKVTLPTLPCSQEEGRVFSQTFENSYLQLAPEQLYGETIKKTMDIHGLGLVLLSMLKGKHVWISWTNQWECDFGLECPVFCDHNTIYHRPRKELRSCVSKSWTLLMDKDLKDDMPQHHQALLTLTTECLALDPEKRPPSAGAVIERIDTLVESKDLPRPI